MRRYIPGSNGKVVPVYYPSDKGSPVSAMAPLRNSPHQSVTVPQSHWPRQYATSGFEDAPVRALASHLTAKNIVQQVPVEQTATYQSAPYTPYALPYAQTLGIYPGAREARYPMPNLQAPARLMSIPGQVVVQSQVVQSGINAYQNTAYQGLKAPETPYGTSYCAQKRGGR
jgi:hypothetical protein